MSPIQIFPRYKLVLTYDVRPEATGAYQHFIVNEMIPVVQDMSLYMLAIWQTAYGPYPSRQLEFVAESQQQVADALADDRWAMLEGELRSFVRNYNRKVIPFRDGFQLVARAPR
jgi:hypothetical protein